MQQEQTNSLNQKEQIASQTLRDLTKASPTNSPSRQLEVLPSIQEWTSSAQSRDSSEKQAHAPVQTRSLGRFPDDILDIAKTLEQLKSTTTESPVLSKKRPLVETAPLSPSEIRSPLIQSTRSTAAALSTAYPLQTSASPSSDVVTPSSSPTRSVHSEFVSSSDVINNEGDLAMKTKPKKRRRKRDEIDRSFKCPIAGCTKSYGSEGALKTHIKLKHNDVPTPTIAVSTTQTASPQQQQQQQSTFVKVGSSSPDMSWQRVAATRETKLVNNAPASIAAPQLPQALQSLSRTPFVASTIGSPTVSTNLANLTKLSPSATMRLQLPLPKIQQQATNNQPFTASMMSSNTAPLLPPLSVLTSPAKDSAPFFRS